MNAETVDLGEKNDPEEDVEKPKEKRKVQRKPKPSQVVEALDPAAIPLELRIEEGVIIIIIKLINETIRILCH